MLKFLKARGDHIIGLAENNLREEKTENAKDGMLRAGWVTSYSPGTKTADAELGTSGGCFLSCRSWLHTVIPDEALGNEGQVLPEGDITWKHARVKGLHFIRCFAYFECAIGLTGSNVARVEGRG